MGRAIVGAFAALALAACSGGAPAPATRAPARKPPAQAAASPAAAQAVEPADFHYDPTGKRDPFRSFLRAMKEREQEDPATPLERFDLAQLRVTAIVWSEDDARALVEDPTGTGYIVRVGTPIGKNHGRVVAIGDGAVKVLERYTDYRGETTEKLVELELHTREGG